MVNFRDKKAVLANYPPDRLLEIGIPQVHFFHRDGQYQALCPFHNDHSLGNFGYNPSKGVWKCFVCGQGGAGVYSLIMKVNGWDFKKTIDYLYEHRNDPVSGFKPLTERILKKKTSMPKKHDSTASMAESGFQYSPDVSSEELNKIYAAFAECSPLNSEERYKLCKKRGLYYRSTDDFFRFPSPFDEAFMDQFYEMIGDELYHRLLGVPGFYWSTERNRLLFIGVPNSLGILNRNVDGLINGIEMRLATSEKGCLRYMPFSSEGIFERHPERFSCGTKLGAIVDIVPPAFPDRPYQGIAITEGKFKAIHLSYLGYTALNIHGIGNWDKIFPVLEQMKYTGKITIAFDADNRSNPPVAANAMAVGIALLRFQYEANYLTWSARLGKGIDDVINAGGKSKLRIIPARRYIETTLAPFIERAKRRQAQERLLGVTASKKVAM